MATVKVDNNNFKADVLEAEGPVVVDFWAEWCGPCKMIGPSLEDIATELAGKVKIAKLNIDENPELAAQFGVRSIPTLMIFKGGEVADMKVGALPEDGSVALDQRQRRLSDLPILVLKSPASRRAFCWRGFCPALALACASNLVSAGLDRLRGDQHDRHRQSHRLHRQ